MLAYCLNRLYGIPRSSIGGYSSPNDLELANGEEQKDCNMLSSEHRHLVSSSFVNVRLFLMNRKRFRICNSKNPVPSTYCQSGRFNL
jgi:hypothetical protein